MNTNFPEERSVSSRPDAVFAALRAKLVREVSGSAMLAELLEKVNRMQEVHASPAEFQGRFNEFVGRAEEYSTAIRPFFPDLVGFLPSRQSADRGSRGRGLPLGQIFGQVVWARIRSTIRFRHSGEELFLFRGGSDGNSHWLSLMNAVYDDEKITRG